MNLKNIGGRLRGHSFRRALFAIKEEFDFDLNFEKGGIEHLYIEFVMDKQYINEK